MNRNLAVGKLALQSSFSQYSQLNDPLGAISGTKSGNFGFHTNIEDGPWWMLDLGHDHAISNIKIFNRCDAGGSRIRFTEVRCLSTLDMDWRCLYAGTNEYGGITDGKPLDLNFSSKPIMTRFIQIVLNDHTALHLDEVEVYGTDPVEGYEARLSAHGAPTIAAENSVPQQLGAIVALTRGYPDKACYSSLIARNLAIYERLNRSLEHQYPLIIWHEGNISREDQEYILSKEKNQSVEFVDVSEVFKLPPYVEAGAMEEHWPLGYRLMCKFNTFDIWNFGSKYKYILRIDEDCMIQGIVGDPFAWAERTNIDLGFSYLTDENHDLSNRSLPHFIAAFSRSRDLSTPIESVYNKLFPYSNVMLARTGFFLQNKVREFLSAAISEKDFYYKRWGDLPVVGAAINLFGEASRIQAMPELIYSHDSHAITIASHDHRPALSSQHEILPPRETPDARLPLQQQEEVLLKDFASRPYDIGVRGCLASISAHIGRKLIAERLLNLEGPSTKIERSQNTAAEMAIRQEYAAAIRCYADMFWRFSDHFEKQAQDFVENFPENGGDFWVAPAGVYGSASSISDIFSTIYRENIWGGGSGGGSFVDRVAMYAGLLQFVIEKHQVKSICDIGCGDWQFSQYVDFSQVSYTGFDVVASVIAENRERFGSDNVRFEQADASRFKVPNCDLVICKDVLQHLSNESACKILQQRHSARLWLLTNDYAAQNRNSRDGDTRPINPAAPPFSLPGRPVFTFSGKVCYLSD